MDRRLWSLAGAAVAVALLGLVSLQSHQGGKPVVLYTAAHAEVAPFSRVWNPDTNNPHMNDEFAVDDKKGDRDEIIVDSLCGTDGSKCPELPAFNGEDYFSSKPIGCCYTPEQQELWSKWKSMADRVAKLEGTVHYLRQLQHEVNLKYSRGPRGPRPTAQSRLHTARATHSPSMLHRAGSDATPDHAGNADSAEGEWGVPLPL